MVQAQEAVLAQALVQAQVAALALAVAQVRAAARALVVAVALERDLEVQTEEPFPEGLLPLLNNRYK